MTTIVRLTRGQQMALTSIVASYMRTEEPQVFINVTDDEETTTFDLLCIVMSDQEKEQTLADINRAWGVPVGVKQ